MARLIFVKEICSKRFNFIKIKNFANTFYFFNALYVESGSKFLSAFFDSCVKEKVNKSF